MTRNQIEAQKLVEQTRHNREMEGLEQRSQDERKRSNLAAEANARSANDNVRRFNESTSAVNWFTARSLDAVNAAKRDDYYSQMQRRAQQNVDDSRRTSAQAIKDEAQYSLIKAQRQEIDRESRRRDSKTRAEINLIAKKGLNQTREFITGVMQLGVTSFAPTKEQLITKQLFK
jgi:hypothetical protein